MRTLLALLVGLLLCAGCAHHPLPPKEVLEANLEVMEEAVSAKVSDPRRAARLNKTIGDLGQQLLSFQEVEDRFRSDFIALNARPNVSRQELEARIAQFDSQRVAIRARVFELHTELIAATTAEEWKALFPRERALLTDWEG